jgi:hypothetical protein
MLAWVLLCSTLSAAAAFGPGSGMRRRPGKDIEASWRIRPAQFEQRQPEQYDVQQLWPTPNLAPVQPIPKHEYAQQGQSR